MEKNMMMIQKTRSGVAKMVQILLAGAMLAVVPACGNSTDQENSETKIAPAAIGAAAVGAVPIADFFYKVITESIDRAQKDAKSRSDRSAFLSSTIEEVYHKMNREASKRKIRPYNVAICAGDLHCSLAADEGIHYAVKSINFQDRHYTVWAFRGGKLSNPTTGGWENWIMMGCHDHQTGQGARTVNFANTAWIGTPEQGIVGCLR
jgi:hypothetical protein